eukprot:jgi/Mesvir1/13851/Mv15996-RA.1
MFHPCRGGVRGGKDQFNWEDVKADKDRENYLGHSIKAPVGRWQKGKDILWYTRDKAATDAAMDEEKAAIQAEEEDRMAVALGLKPKRRPPLCAGANGAHALDKKDMEALFSRRGAGEGDEGDVGGATGDRVQGLGAGSQQGGSATCVSEVLAGDVLPPSGTAAPGTHKPSQGAPIPNAHNSSKGAAANGDESGASSSSSSYSESDSSQHSEGDCGVPRKKRARKGGVPGMAGGDDDAAGTGRSARSATDKMGRSKALDKEERKRKKKEHKEEKRRRKEEKRKRKRRKKEAKAAKRAADSGLVKNAEEWSARRNGRVGAAAWPERRVPAPREPRGEDPHREPLLLPVD